MTCPECGRNSFSGVVCGGCGYLLAPEAEVGNGIGPGEAWLVAELRHQTVDMRINQIVTLCGPPGSGKSWGALRIGSLVDERFTLDRVVLPGPDAVLATMRAIADPAMPPGSAIVPDDLGLLVPAREFYTLLNRGFGLMAQSSRYLRKVVLATVPDQTFVDAQPRKLTHYHMEFRPRPSPEAPALGILYEVQANPRSGKIYYKHPELGPARKLDGIYLQPPSVGLARGYETRKHREMNAYYRVLIDELETGGTPEHVHYARAIVLLATFGADLGKTQTEIAADLGMRSEHFSRALSRSRKRVTVAA